MAEWTEGSGGIRLGKGLLKLLRLYKGLRSTYRGSDVARRVQRFDGWTDRSSADDAETKDYDHAKTVKEYYDLCSELMIFGWGESLHFAPLSRRESLQESKIRHQRLMISKLELREGMTVVDIGCGIGGPMRRVVREAGVRVLGVNYSEVQLAKARSLNAEAEVDHMVDYLAASFMDMGVIADATYDRAYAIESTCHAPDKVGAFAEIYRVLKPGSLFWGQEMCLTDRFDPYDSEHQAIKQALMHGIALKDIATTGEVDGALATAGFEVLEGIDRAVDGTRPSKPWYQPMATRIRMQNLKAHIGVAGLAEALRALPKGTKDVIRVLDRTAGAYVAGGRTGIFTPLYCFLARKPL